MAIKEEIKGRASGLGVVKYFQNISADRKNGIFILKTEKGTEVQILFYDGKIVHAESDVRNRDEAILNFLIQSGVIDKKIKGKILKKKAKKKAMSVVSILLEEKPDSEESIRKALKARTDEILSEVLLADELTFDFVEKGKSEIGFNPKVYRPVNTDSLIFELARVVDEWKGAVENAKVKEGVPLLLEAVDESTAKKLRIPPDFIHYIDGKRAIIEIARISKTSLYEAAIHISELVKHGLAEIITAKKIKMEGEGEGWREKAVKIFQNATAVIILLFAGAFVYSAFHKRGAHEAVVRSPQEYIKEMAVEKQMMKIKTAIEVYRLLHGEYPETLHLLVEKGLLKEEDLTFPLKRGYYYRRNEDKRSYELTR